MMRNWSYANCKADYYSCPSPQISGYGVREINNFLNFFDKSKIKVGKCLEIASFDGYLLRKLKQRKWDVYGIDPATMTLEAKKLIGKNRIKKKYFKKYTYPKKSFDLVIFRNFLEHIVDLENFMENVSHVLKSDGKILVEVPNIKYCIPFRCYGIFFHQHLSHFSLEVLRLFLNKKGFKIIRSKEADNLYVFAQKIESSSSNKIKRNMMEKNHISNKIKRNMIQKKYISTLYKMYKKTDLKIKNIFKKNKKIVLFGASAISTTLISQLNKRDLSKIKLVVDNDFLKHGKQIFGLNVKISKVNDIKKIEFDKILLTSYIYKKEMKKQLSSLSIPRNKIELVYAKLNDIR